MKTIGYDYILQNAQIFLIELGKDLAPHGADGYWGVKTMSALNEFRRENGLETTDFLDNATYAFLKEKWISRPNILPDFWRNRMAIWTFPFVNVPLLNPSIGLRYFGAARDKGKRAHAGIDYIAETGKKVFAMASGKVMQFSPDFYKGTQAVSVRNTDNTVIRYGEIKAAVRLNDIINQGDLIGTVMTNKDGGHMLHLEVFMGDCKGSLTNKKNTEASASYTYVPRDNYQRRKDLIDPTNSRFLSFANDRT